MSDVSLLASAGATRWVCFHCRALNSPTAAACGCGLDRAAAQQPDVSAAAGALPRWLPALLQAGLVAGLFLAYRIVGMLARHALAPALTHARDLWQVERWLHLPSELSFQRALLAFPRLVESLNVYYVAAHVASLVLVLVWLYTRHREHYARWRNTVAAFTAACLAVQLVPVAPPRMLPGLGFVDTGLRFHQSIYGAHPTGLTDQLSSLPSIHVGWALLVAAAVLTASRSRWRWLVCLHPVLTVVAVVATANHFWADCIAAAALAASAPWLTRRLGGSPPAR